MGTHGPSPSQDSIKDRWPSLLLQAEALFGPREPNWFVRGVRFDVNGPHIRFVDSLTAAIWIELKILCIRPIYYPDQMLHQLAHEVVHLLEPNRNPPTSMLEEGAAVWFSVHAPSFWSDEYAADAHAHLITQQDNYGKAYRGYLEAVSHSSSIIKDIRAAGIRMGDVRSSDILQQAPQLDPNVADLLSDHRKMR